MIEARSMGGGQSALTSAIRVENGRGERDWLILRRFVTEWQQSPRKKALNEHRALSALGDADVPTPRPLWLDDRGKTFGAPAVIQTRLPGRAWWPDAIPRAAQMGQALAHIHACRPPQGLSHPRDRVGPFLGQKKIPPFLRDAHPAASKIWKALKSAGTAPLEDETVLLHGDYHAANLLWARGRLTGVLDWETAQAGPRGRDVGYTRMDCTIMGGPEMAAAFTEAYGEQTKDLWFWELLAAIQGALGYRHWSPAWRHYGLPDLRLRTVRRRLDAFIDRVLRAAPG